MEIRLEKPALNNFKAYGGKNEQLDGRGGWIEVKYFSCTYSLF